MADSEQQADGEDTSPEEIRLAALQKQIDTLDENVSSMRAQLNNVTQLLENGGRPPSAGE